jgi:hypothetical protein
MTDHARKAEDAVGMIVAAAFVVAMFALLIILDGYLVRVLWGWFLSPTFGVASPSVAACIGLMTMRALLIPSPNADKPEGSAFFSRWAAHRMLILAVGWCAARYV